MFPLVEEYRQLENMKRKKGDSELLYICTVLVYLNRNTVYH